MKKLNILLGILAMLFIVSPVWSAGIQGTDHDFTTKAWNNTGELCVVCHTPHNAVSNQEPLWNHEVTVSTFTLYSSNTLNSTPGQPDGTSKLCLSCHDGTIALDNFGNTTGGTNYITGGAKLDADLTNDHPISITYDATLSTLDGGLFDPSSANSGLGNTIDIDLLFGGKMQCASCHDVHDDTNGKFLRINNAGSALCLTCHDK